MLQFSSDFEANKGYMLHVPEGNTCIFLLKYRYELFGRLAFE